MVLRKPLFRFLLLSAIALAPSATGTDETVRFKALAPEVVESRLKQYGGDDLRR